MISFKYPSCIVGVYILISVQFWEFYFLFIHFNGIYVFHLSCMTFLNFSHFFFFFYVRVISQCSPLKEYIQNEANMISFGRPIGGCWLLWLQKNKFLFFYLGDEFFDPHKSKQLCEPFKPEQQIHIYWRTIAVIFTIICPYVHCLRYCAHIHIFCYGWRLLICNACIDCLQCFINRYFVDASAG